MKRVAKVAEAIINVILGEDTQVAVDFVRNRQEPVRY
jgi:hypothetical protein